MAQVVALVDRDEREGTVRRSTCALLTLARRFGDPVAVCATRPGDETIKVLGYHGATEIWYPDTAVVPSSPRMYTCHFGANEKSKTRSACT